MAALFVVLIKKVRWHDFKLALALANVTPLVLAALVAVTVCMWGCIERLFVLLGPLPHTQAPVRRRELAAIHYASSAAHNLLPAPAGEVLRTVQLTRRHGYSVGGLVGVQLVEKVIEALGLSLEIVAVSLLSPLPRAIGVSMTLFASLTAVGTLFVLILAWRYQGSEASLQAPHRETRGFSWRSVRLRLVHFLHKLAEGISLVRSPRRWLISLSSSAMADLGNVLTVGLTLYALGVQLPISAWFLIMLAARMVGLVPSTPGQWGVQEAAVVGVMTVLHVDVERALAAATLHHIVHFVPVTAIGLIELRRLWTPKEEAV